MPSFLEAVCKNFDLSLEDVKHYSKEEFRAWAITADAKPKPHDYATMFLEWKALNHEGRSNFMLNIDSFLEEVDLDVDQLQTLSMKEFNNLSREMLQTSFAEHCTLLAEMREFQGYRVEPPNLESTSMVYSSDEIGTHVGVSLDTTSQQPYDHYNLTLIEFPLLGTEQNTVTPNFHQRQFYPPHIGLESRCTDNSAGNENYSAPPTSASRLA